MDRDLNLILDKYGDTVYRVALSKTCDPEAAQDIYQDTFLLLLEKKPSFSDTAQARAWLVRTAIKLASAHRRKGDNSKTEPLDDTHTKQDDTLFELIEVMKSLDTPLRAVTMLYYVDDMSQKEIASVLGITVGAVKMRLKRAKNALRKIYKEELL